jgi:hypothetical protein
MPKTKRHSVKRRYNKNLRFGKNKRGAGKGTLQKGDLKSASELFPLSKTRKVPTITTTRITALNFPQNDTVFDEIKQGEELEAMTTADRASQAVEFYMLMEKAHKLPVLNDDCPDGICRIMGGKKSRRRRRNGHKHRKSRR